ncbi:MAG: hypothetical protein JSS66_07720 [Armatimonadetes bacterium]|nr:hypothetical protein [Armatimonadota bacterium]
MLNRHRKMSNGYCGIEARPVARFNRLLKKFPDLHIVVSSAWRYMILGKDMTIRGFEEMLCTHGVDCFGRVFGHTCPDENFWPANPSKEDYADLTVRVRQIAEHVAEHAPLKYVVFDDLPLPMRAPFVHIDGTQGLQNEDVVLAMAYLKDENLVLPTLFDSSS